MAVVVMLFFQSPYTCAAMNAAIEEYFMNIHTEAMCMIYINTPAVLIGRNQNAWAEADIGYLWINSIPLVRRMSGGGTVYHDEGNVNFSFIFPA